MQQLGNLPDLELSLMQVNDPHKGLNVTLDRTEGVMGLLGNLIIGRPSQPTADNLGFVGLTPTNSLESMHNKGQECGKMAVR